jgi:hypothetical protein
MTAEAAPLVSRETLPTPVEATRDCSRCEGALDTTGAPAWCKKCRAAYQREYKRLVKDMSESRGFSAGVSALRDALVRQFAASGGTFTGPMAANWIRHFRLPAK